MWKPPQRIKYQTAVAQWPTKDTAGRAQLFSPITLGSIELQQRTWIPAMVPWRSNEAGEVTQDVIDWYARFAQGKPGAIVVEATGIRDIPSGPLLRISDDRYIEGLRRLVDAVREASGGQTRLLIQLIDFLNIRRRPEPRKYFERFLIITPEHRRALNLHNASEVEVRQALASLSNDDLENILSAREWDALQFGARDRVTDLGNHLVSDLPQTLPRLFATAAMRAKKAGFDGVELHYAHAYTMSSFLSATNTRTDGYGGEVEGRVRLPLEVFAAVRERRS